ncbi:hypothetical protein RvY_15982-2 [Ramazzottius varieornatus]|uniref:Uncharacterized protein n=1 Tax=Ramazzottius varieornatus TaxID=947166 RepID=A0A1D1VY88_RAMVA|nr:hypothetical protein RvY_15982-2 [Ramazzottius varieornatus]
MVRFPPYNANTDLASCDYADIKVWAPTCIVRKPETARQRNKTVAMLLQRMNKNSIESTRGIYKGLKVSPRGRAHGYTIDVNGNIFEKSGDTVPCRVTNAVGCLGVGIRLSTLRSALVCNYTF